MAAISREQTAQYLIDAGFTGETLVKLVAIAGRESAYTPTAHRSDTTKTLLRGDRGLFQINSVWDKQLMAAGIIKQKSDLFDPAVNARAAKYVFDKQGLGAWGAASGGYSKGGDPLHGTDVEAARAAVNTVTSGGYKQMATPGSTTAGPLALPSDALVMQNTKGTGLMVLFNLGGGVHMRFAIQKAQLPPGQKVTTFSDKAFAQWLATSVDGGNAAELSNVKTTYGTFGSFWNSVTAQTIGYNNPAANDPQVRKVLAEFAGRPDMSEAEFKNKLQATSWYKSRTESELRWNSLSPAEQGTQRQDAVSRMTASWQQFVGHAPTAADLKLINANVDKVASGKMSMNSWQETWLKPRALQVKESPWSRQVRGEQEDQRQRGVDTENTVSQLRSLAQRWGVQPNEAQLHQWATGIVEKKLSDDDVLNTIKGQANAKYGAWKRDPNVETSTQAAPWVDTYSRVMEDSGTLFTPEIAKALQSGQTVADFEVGLKKSQKWLSTKNARQEMFQLAGDLGKTFGYT